MSTFIIAEAGVNHNGRDDLAYALVDAAVAAGADAIKFQTFSAAKVVQKSAAKAAYQKDVTGEGSQFEMLSKLEMSHDLHRGLMAYCEDKGIEFMSTPFDTDSADFLKAEGMKRIKIPSGEITNVVFLRHLAGLGLPMIVSTGMATLDEIHEAVATLRAHWPGPGPADEALCVLHCTSNYPTAPENVNLRAMATIAGATCLPVGYSDHTLGIAVCTAAVAMGARVLEKHFTLDRTMEGPDHKASLEPDELAAMIAQVRVVEAALGSAEKAPTESEQEMRILARRSIAAARDLAPGTVLTDADLVLLRPATGIAPRDYDSVIGRRVTRPVAGGDTLTWDDLR
jgi:N-acetylneuraminate synthase